MKSNDDYIGDIPKTLFYAVLDTVEMAKHLYKLGINVSEKAVNEYAKQCIGREPQNDYEFSRALGMKILEETEALEHCSMMI